MSTRPVPTSTRAAAVRTSGQISVPVRGMAPGVAAFAGSVFACAPLARPPTVTTSDWTRSPQVAVTVN
jgi:hypothetical protein